jgi:hypothetical protein
MPDLTAGAAANGHGTSGKSQTGSREEGHIMLDIIFIAATALFFSVGVFYVRGCERLK